MNAFDIPHNFIAVLAALVLALALSATPAASAFAQEMSTTEVLIEHAAPINATQLRHLLSQPNRSLEEQRQLERTLNDIYEELADASSGYSPAHS